MRLAWLVGAAALLAACDGTTGGGDDDWISSDQRIDGAGAGDEIESVSARMCVAGNGNVYAVWYDDREGDFDVWFQASRDGGRSWMGQPVQVNHSEGAATNPDVACIGNTAFVVWEDTRDGELENKNIYINRSDSAGTRWLEEDVLLDGDDKGKAMSIGPRIAAEGDEVHVVWSDAINGAYDIYSASSTNRGSSFSAPVRVDSDSAGSAFSAFPQIRVDGQGTVLVAWEDARDGLNDIYAALSKDSGKSFGDDVRLDGGDNAGSADSFSPRLAMEGDQAYVVWHDERNGASRDIYMNYSSDGGATWAAEAMQVETDGAGKADSTFPDVALSGGIAHVAWQDKRHSGFDVFYRSYEFGEARAVSADRAAEEEPLEADGELRLDRGDRAGYSNALNVRVAAVQDHVVIAWEDRRWDGIDLTAPNDPDSANPQGFNDIYYNYSEDVGDTWFDEDRRLDSYCRGQKWANNISLAVANDQVLALWHDGRRGNSDIMFAQVKIGDQGAPIPDLVCIDTGGDAGEAQ